MKPRVGRFLRGIAAPFAAFVIVIVLWGAIVAAPGPTSGGADARAATLASGPIPAEQTQLGWILLPTPDPARTFTPMTLRGATFEKLSVTSDAPFLLRAQQSGSASACIANQCARTGDFDLIFYRERADGTAVVIERHANVGNEEGRVPAHASFAFAFLRTPATQPDVRGSGFVYLEGGPGSNMLPAWPPGTQVAVEKGVTMEQPAPGQGPNT